MDLSYLNLLSHTMYIQSVLFKTGSLHNTVWVFIGLIAIILVFHSGIMQYSTNNYGKFICII